MKGEKTETMNNKPSTSPLEKKGEKRFTPPLQGGNSNSHTAVKILFFVIAMIFAGLMTSWTKELAKEWLHPLLPNLSPSRLKEIAYAVEFIGCGLLFLLWKRKRTLFDLFINTLFPIGFILMLGALKCYWWMWIVIIVIVFFFYLASSIAMKMTTVTRRECLRFALAFFSMILLFLGTFGGLKPYSYSSHQTEIAHMSIEEATKQHRENCRALEESVWSTLSTQEKLDILQKICDYECKFVLGCKEIKLYSGITSRETVLGNYSNQTSSITIQEKHLTYDDVEIVLDTALHEIRHAYQYAWTKAYAALEPYIKEEDKDLIPFKQAQDFAEEFSDYYSGERQFYKYFMQSVEQDSREWARKRINEFYIDFISPA